MSPRIDLSGVGSLPQKAGPGYELSPQQKDVIEFIRNPLGFGADKGLFIPGVDETPNLKNANLIAVAGSGKTSTLIELCMVIPSNQSVAAAMFNKKAADHFNYKLTQRGAGKNVKAATFHSFGLAAWKKVAGFSIRVDADKMETICAEIGVPKHYRAFVKSLVSIAKQQGIGILCEISDWEVWEQLVDWYDLEDKLSSWTDDETDNLVLEGIEWAMKALAVSIDKNLKLIDFDDMLYAPLKHEALFNPNDVVLIDEAQDTNATRRLMARAMLRDGGRLIAVGDPRQAIYGFTGANADSLELIAKEFDCIEIPLTVSYRCPKAVVRFAQRWVKHIEAAPDAPEGSVRSITEEEFKKLIPEPTDAILCRNTKPLIEMALGFLRKRIAAHVEGRDIGGQLLALVRKWKRVRTIDDLQEKLEEHYTHESIRLMEKGQEKKIEQLKDKIESIYAIMETLHGDDDVEEVARLIDSIFKDTDGRPIQSITLSTIHKAKGREWPRVYLYGRGRYMPSPFATQPWQLEQENNLIYVAVTRAMQELVEIHLPPRL